MKIGSLFTGYGGLDQAAEQAFDARTVWTSDIDPGASKIIAHRYPDVPNLGDITAIDWGADVEPVDIITGGWPCQPFSLAGKRKGAADERALWPFVAGAVRALRPRYVVLENVSAIATAGTGPELARATASLAALGYVGSWLRLRASDIGAPHRRERIFIVAVADSDRQRDDRAGRAWNRGTEPTNGRVQPIDLLPTPQAMDTAGAMAHRRETSGYGPASRDIAALLPTPTATPYGNNQSNSAGAAVRPSLDSLAPLLPTPRATDGTKGGPNQRGSSGDLMLPSAVTHLLPTPSVADVTGGRKSRSGTRSDELLLNGIAAAERFGQYAEAIARWTPIVGRPAPDPTVNGRLSPRFVEFMMGIPDGWVCDVPGLSRAQQLKALGNGVVPQQAYAAITHMITARAAA